MTGRFLGLVVLLSFAGQRFSEAQTTQISNFSLHDSRGATHSLRDLSDQVHKTAPHGQMRNISTPNVIGTQNLHIPQ